MKQNIYKNEGAFKTHKSYSPEDVFAAGGTTAFAIKNGNTNEKLIKALENAPPIEPFTQEEWDSLMTQVKNDK